jgi:hypothetical protein
MNFNTGKLMRVLISALGLAFCLDSMPPAAGADLSIAAGDSPAGVARDDAVGGKAGGVFIVGISPFLDSSAKDPVYRGLVRLIVEELPLNTRLQVYDAFNLRSITLVSIPSAKVFNSPKTRANQFASSIGEIKQFLARDNARPAGSKADFDGSIRLPQFFDFLAQRRPPQGGDAKLPLLLIGSPLYQDTREPAFSMVDGYFPSDGHLRASREESIYGLNPGDASSQPLMVDWVYFGDPWISDLHREKVERFWALYIERRGGRLASFSSDFATAMNAFTSEAPGAGAAANGWVADPLQTRPEMVRATRSVQLADWLTGDALPETTPPPPSRFVGPLKIGIRWKPDIDLDLYATPHPGAETLFFDHRRSPEGYYFKDHRSSPGREYEYIEFESPVDVRDVRGFVNFYNGSCRGGPHGEIRIEFLNRIYRGDFAIESADGNQGRSGRSQSRFWTEIPIREILRIDDISPQSASASR